MLLPWYMFRKRWYMVLFNVLRKRMSKKNNTPENMHCLVCVYKLFVNNIKKNDVTPFFINTSNKDKLTIPRGHH